MKRDLNPSFSTTLMVILSLLSPCLKPLKSEPPPTDQQQQASSSSDSGGDRSGNSGAAAAAAAAGAAMAGLGCIMGLKAAAEEQDPKMKAMLRMQAMQQCAQAAQNAASAAQNGDQKKKLDTPPGQNQMTPFQPPELKEPEDGEKPDLSKLAQGQTSSSSNKDTEDKFKPFEPPAEPTTKETQVADIKAPTGPVLPATSTPQMIDANTITAKKDENENATGNEASKVLGSALASGKGSADDLLKKALAETGANLNQTPIIKPEGSKRRDSGSEGDGGGSGGGFSNSESKGSDPFDSLLAQMMGGNSNAASGEGGYGGGMQVVSLPSDKNGKPKLNIFQFASSVYSELAHTANRVKMRPNPKARPSERTLTSVTNTVTKASIR
ncbi:MAG: hypothetical protein ACKOA8_16695 [Deltaproteobacteria bacterium]